MKNSEVKKTDQILQTQKNVKNDKEDKLTARQALRQFFNKKRKYTKDLTKLNDIAIEVSNLSFKYNPSHPNVLHNVNFKIKHGEYVTIIGRNGSGKSTLSKIIIGVLSHQKGHLKIFGHEVTNKNLSQVRRFLGIVFQNPDNQFIGSTVEDDIAFGLENRQIISQKMGPIVIKAAKKVGMDKFLESEPLMLSGGQKQKVAIASALALAPQILIFDEATSMLDPKGISDVNQVISTLRKNTNQTIISITHNMEEILNADKVLILNGGNVLKFGTPKEILEDEKTLIKCHLGIPFVKQVYNQFNDKGIKLKQTLSTDELAESLVDYIHTNQNKKKISSNEDRK